MFFLYNVSMLKIWSSKLHKLFFLKKKPPKCVNVSKPDLLPEFRQNWFLCVGYTS